MPERAMQFARRYRGFLAASLLVTGGLAAAASISLQSARKADEARLEAVTERNRAESERQRAEAALARAETSNQEAISQSREAGAQKSVAERERNLAHTRFNEQRQLLGQFIEEVQDKIQGLPGAGPAREQSLTLATSYLEKMSKDRDAGPEVLHHLALAYLRLGDYRGGPTTTNHQSDPRGAVALYAKANAILDTPGMRRDPASLGVLVRLRSRQAELHQYFGDRQSAAAALDEGIRIGRQLHARTRAANAEAAVPLLRVLNTSALQAVQRRELDAALAMASECRTLAEQSRRTPVVIDYLAACTTMEGRAHALLGDFPKSLAELRRAIEIREAVLRESPANNGNRRDLMLLFGHLSATLYHPVRPSLKDLPGALQALDQARSHAARIAHSDPSDRLGQRDLAISTNRYADLLLSARQWDKAAVQFEESSRMIESLLPALSEDTSLRNELVFALIQLGEAYQSIQERKAQAIPVLRRAVRGAEELLAFQSLQASTYVNLSAAYARLAKALQSTTRDEAAKAFARAREIYQAGRKVYPNSQELISFEKRELSGAYYSQ